MEIREKFGAENLRDMAGETRQCEEFRLRAAASNAGAREAASPIAVWILRVLWRLGFGRRGFVPRFGWNLFIFAFSAALVCGCVTTKLPNIDEYRELTKEGHAGVQAAVRSLDEIATHPSNASSKRLANYERDVQSLQVKSIRLRERARAIEARGDAYFASWSETLANLENRHVREAASRSRPELEASFARLKAASQRAGAAFRPFFASLKKLRVELEIKPGGLDSVEDRELIREASENGREVLQQLQTIDAELATMRKILTSK